jgi:hypothetical protein
MTRTRIGALAAGSFLLAAWAAGPLIPVPGLHGHSTGQLAGLCASSGGQVAQLMFPRVASGCAEIRTAMSAFGAAGLAGGALVLGAICTRRRPARLTFKELTRDARDDRDSDT